MNWFVRLWRRLPPFVIDLLAVAVAVADAVIYAGDFDPLSIVLTAVACGGLLLRRRFPLIAFILTLPSNLVQNLLAAPMIALFTLSRISRRRWLLAVCAAAFAVSTVFPWPLTADGDDQFGTAVYFVYQLATAAAPLFLGQLVQAREDLAKRLAEIERAREHERELYAESVLTRERAQLAREMHDVVSHQVSLIAVQAAALQVAGTSPDAREAGGTIRRLSVTTLDELRSMVALLRVAGSSSPGLAPQPTMSDLRALVNTSGIAAEVHGELPADVGVPVQRALYRTVQEALTNVRKHAPDASVTIEFSSTVSTVTVVVANARATRPALTLPGAGVGLIGLRERADLLGGTFTAEPTADGGFRVSMTLPVVPD